MGVIMSDSQGQGFTASIVNSIANYVSADRSVLGMADGTTGAIQYVKLVWGGSGEVNFVSETGTDPSALPVSLSNADNFWLTDAIINTVHRTSAGNTAFRVAIDGAGLCFAGACFGNISLGAGMTVLGFAPGSTNANLGVTFGTVGVTASFLRMRNFVSGAGVTEAFVVGGTVNIGGGTVAISNSLSVDFGNGVTIAGIRAGFTLPVSIGAGGLSLGSDPIVARIASVAGGVTIGVALTTPGGTFFPGAYQGIPVFGVSGATALGVTISGPISITASGLLGVTFTGSFSSTTTLPASGITIASIASGALVGITAPAPIEIFTNQVLGVSFDQTVGTTFGTVRVVGVASSPIGVSLGNLGSVGLSGDALKVAFDGSGLCMGTVNATLNIPATGITIAKVLGGTLDNVTIKGGTLTTLGGTVAISNTVAVGGTVTATINNADGSPVPIKISSYTPTSGNGLKTLLDGLKVEVSGGSQSSVGATLVSNAGSTWLGVFATGSVDIRNNISLATNTEILVKGHSDTRGVTPVSPVGITFTGALFNLRGLTMADGSGIGMGISLAGVGLSGNALKVSLEGVGICLGTVTLNSASFAVFGSGTGATAVNISQKSGDTFGTVLTDVTGKVLGHSGSQFIGLPVFGVSGGTAFGTTFSTVKALVGPDTTLSGASGVFKINLVKSDGSGFHSPADGVPVYGSTNATPVGITWTGTPTFSVGNTVGVRGSVGIDSGAFIEIKGHTETTGTAGTRPLGITFTGSLFDLRGLAMKGLSGVGIGVSLGGVGMSGDALKVSLEGVGICLGTISFSGGFPDAIGICGGVTIAGGTISFISGGTFNVLGGTLTGISNPVTVTGTVSIRPLTFNSGFSGMSGGGTTFNSILTDVRGVPIGHNGAGSFIGFPAYGVSGATAVGVTMDFGVLFDSVNGRLKVTGGINILNTPDVTISSGTITTITNEVSVKTNSGVSLGVTFGTVKVQSASPTGTFGVVFTNAAGTPLGLSGATVVGVPVVGVLGATAVAVTFGSSSIGVTFGGITFGGITFATTRSILVGSAFADGGNNLGVPVYGVAGTTAVRVDVVGGTVAAIFVADAPGITILGVTSGIAVFGVSGATALGVTFGPITSTTTFPNTGITIGAFTSNITGLTITGTVGLASGAQVSISGNPTVQITADVPIKAGSNMTNSDKLLGNSLAAGVLITEKQGPAFAVGLTLGNFIQETTSSSQANVVGVSGATFYFFSTTPFAVTKNWIGDGRNGTISGNPSVPLRQGLHIQLTKWDLISHVLIGYTAASQFEFERNAQVLTKEYQMAPIWSHAADQFRRYPGFTGNNSPVINNDFDSTHPFTDGLGNLVTPVQKQYIGVIEKPTRIFVPCRDAGEVYVQVKGDYQSHAIGSGFWNQETGVYTPYSLYERSYYANNIYGFTGGEPNMTDSGGKGSTSDYGSNPEGVNIIQLTVSGKSVITTIFEGYANNPFIRIWGY
jgi:hypothetical protein